MADNARGAGWFGGGIWFILIILIVLFIVFI
ncbi:hypothetical protein SPX_41490 [Sporomusa paucivorans]|jgi:hypothetical protein|uniref:Sporulation protein YjcZ n=1 Tax=Sporomusa sphaeroides DSM 2875 TaxID=1337886 RepID=A0ABM9W5L3_9FIRM|nr:hypothetical protein SPSPH_25110 [Sporomusa sphaeroides DSM 2875]CVK19236.1 hypothetical protein SSPH_01885 [Sporomusa sphaeroides DSM 2875]